MLFPRIENIQLSFFAAVAAAFEASNKKKTNTTTIKRFQGYFDCYLGDVDMLKV